ncbi:ankyrin repeat domain-containing protein [Sphingomonas sp. SRS2]|uniref:ankyrin repeat domain-containing protein n=1 Tax=Sphingomonas sp. SRS2 TaxID=133190 RepID=UPI0006184C2E|nr:ankyrin repeat domain-containing protein [Sphingomonas sp. SRS2]KKC26551.1 ankyrin [Sphingomonas sp. SRS2]
MTDTMVRRHILSPVLWAAAALAIAATPAMAQFSDSYNFLNAVRQSDGEKATKALQGNGSTIINTRDYTTGETALMITIKRRDLTWSSFLLGKGANPNARDAQGNGALHVAALLGFQEGAELLVAQRAQVNLANNSGETPLIIAVQQRNTPMVRFLLTNGADPKQADRIAGKSARDYAADDPRGAAVLKILNEAPAVKAKPKMSGPGL